MFIPSILKKVDLPDIFVPVSTIPLSLIETEFDTGLSKRGWIPSLISKETSFVKLDLHSTPLSSFDIQI